MKAVLFCLISVFLCAIANIITQKKLTNISPFVSAGIVPLAQIIIVIPLVLIVKSSGTAQTLPQGNAWLFVFAIGALYFFANLCFFSAYKSGITIMAATTMAILLPVFASIIKFGIDKSLPTTTQLVGYILAIAAVYLVNK